MIMNRKAYTWIKTEKKTKTKMLSTVNNDAQQYSCLVITASTYENESGNKNVEN